jgi:hypothetical protein
MVECHEGNLDTAQSNFTKTGLGISLWVPAECLSTYTGKINIALSTPFRKKSGLDGFSGG